MKKEFMKAMDFRHACKAFDETKKISDEDMQYILEAGRKSPSSFGMEAWKFLVITNDELKEKLRPVCWNQVQITSCSHLLVLLAGIDSLKVESGEVKKRFARRDMPKESLDLYMGLYADHLKDILNDDDKIFDWSSEQVHIASANMMTAGAVLGIDSCPIGGYEKQKVEEILDIDTTQYQVSLILPFGYRLNEQSEQLRLAFDDVVEFIQ